MKLIQSIWTLYSWASSSDSSGVARLWMWTLKVVWIDSLTGHGEEHGIICSSLFEWKWKTSNYLKWLWLLCGGIIIIIFLVFRRLIIRKSVLGKECFTNRCPLICRLSELYFLQFVSYCFFFLKRNCILCISFYLCSFPLFFFFVGKDSLLFIILVICIGLQCLEIGPRWVRKNLFFSIDVLSFPYVVFLLFYYPPLHWKWMIYCLWQDIKMTLVFKKLLECQWQ